MLKGEAKTKYQREYMRRKRAGRVNPKPSTASEIIERANAAIDRATVNATIERCAQVVERYAVNIGEMAHTIAGELRALKDKP